MPRTWPQRRGAGRRAARGAQCGNACPAPSGFSFRCAPDEGLVGVVGLQRQDDRALFTPDERRLLDALLDQTALAIERSKLVERVDEAQVLAEADKLRVAMLTSLSHDLRTPLASILGAATTLIASRNLYDDRQTDELLVHHPRGSRAARPVCRQSSRHVAARGRRAGREARRSRSCRAGRDGGQAARPPAVRAQLAVDLPPIFRWSRPIPCCLEQAIFNSLDNAAKYAPPDPPSASRPAGSRTSYR